MASSTRHVEVLLPTDLVVVSAALLFDYSQFPKEKLREEQEPAS